DRADQGSLEDELHPHATTAYAHRADRADLVGAFHHVHRHRVHDREQYDHAHHERDKDEDRAEHRPHLDVEGRQVQEVAHLEVQVVVGDELHQPRAHHRQVLGAVELQHDSGHLVLAAAVHELLGEAQVHRDVVVIKLAHALWLGARHRE